MPTLDAATAPSHIKLIYIGDSGTGKTGSLTSLLAAGYKFKILDMDNGLDALIYYARQTCPDKLSSVEYETFRDEYRSTKAGPVIKGQPKAFVQALDQITQWSEIEDTNTIFVMDSLSAFGKAALEWAKGLSPMAKDGRQWYGAAQAAVENILSMITGPAFKMNVIIISHVNYKEVMEGVTQGHVNAVGSALGPIIPRYFNTLVLAESSGSGKQVRRKIKTMPTGVINLKFPNPTIEAELDLSSGLATIFAKLKETV